MSKQFDVISLGGANFDIPVTGVPHDVMSRGSAHVDIRMATGGDALNGAISMASLGAKTALMSYVGCDEFGDAVLQRLKEANVDTTYVIRDPEFMTTVAYLLIEDSGERHILNHGYKSVKKGLTAKHVTDEILSTARHLHYASVNSNKFLDGEDIGDIFARAKKLGLSTSMDAGFDRDGVWLPKAEKALYNCDIFFPSYSEAVPIAEGRKDLYEMTEFFRQYGLHYFGCKLGAEGVFFYDYQEEKEYRMGTLLRGDVVDTTGAGDAFFAGFIAAYLRGWSIEDCLALGSAQSALIIESVGANMGVRDLAAALTYAKDSGCIIEGAKKEGLI